MPRPLPEEMTVSRPSPEHRQEIHARADQPVRLARALADLLRHPLALLELWNWKAAALSAIVRGAVFLAANLGTGRHNALRAMLVETVFAIVASGLMGAITQRLSNAHPLAATALLVWLLLPAAMLAGEAALHLAFGTQHLRAGLIASFVMASASTGFGWFAQRRGALLAGPQQASALEDLRAMPSILADFLLAAPRAFQRN